MYRKVGRGEKVGLVLALIIFIGCYVLIMLEVFNRAFIALLGGLLMALSGVAPLRELLLNAVDWDTILLLFSMMVLVAITSQTGVFEFVSLRLAKRVGARPVMLLVVISCLTAVGSAFLDNVTTVLLIVPVVLRLTQTLKLPSHPFLISVILFSNIGGTATLIGDPPNLMIGQAVEHLDFNAFIVHLAPVVLIIFFVTLLCIAYFYRGSLRPDSHLNERLVAINPYEFLKKGPVLTHSLWVLALTILTFMLHSIIHIEMAKTAFAGALLLILLTYPYVSLKEVSQRVDWETLCFFTGLFMLVGGLAHIGLIDMAANGLLDLTDGDLPRTGLIVLWGGGLFSGFIDNIPFVATMIPVIKEIGNIGISNVDPLWWSLALGACLGGNATLIGASANVIVTGYSKETDHPLKFVSYMKVGIPVVLLSLIISSVYVALRYLAHYY